MPFKASRLYTCSHWPRGEWSGGGTSKGGNGIKKVGNHCFGAPQLCHCPRQLRSSSAQTCLLAANCRLTNTNRSDMYGNYTKVQNTKWFIAFFWLKSATKSNCFIWTHEELLLQTSSIYGRSHPCRSQGFFARRCCYIPHFEELFLNGYQIPVSADWAFPKWRIRLKI